jgi:hypothetical protein
VICRECKGQSLFDTATDKCELNCGDDRYYDEDLICHDFPINCTQVTNILGHCTQCLAGFNIINIGGFDRCEPPPCPTRHWRVIENQLECSPNSANCEIAEDTTGNCLTCDTLYEV